ncbi:MAG: hypothetical protein GYA02_04505 [Clostridiaceae bacterium]|jgi:hypothetical protein|nr:hypothetical protein [Clostridiaceae bacterium]
MENLKNYLQLSDYHLRRFEDMYTRYKKLYTDPENCEPMFIINTPIEGQRPWEERLADPMVMLKEELDAIRPHLEIEDDRVPTVRVQFGTAQVAAAFGCEMFIPPNNLPAAGSHVIKESRDVYKLEKPSLEAGWYAKLKQYTEVFLENLPEGVHIQHPDIQSPFNNAHLIRGNDILYDFYDDPDAVDVLLDKITDYMIELTFYLKNMISGDKEWFFDWGALWKGTARISNCTVHLISPEQYKKHVLPRDMRFIHAIGGGRMHYCGTYGKVIDEFFKNTEVTGLDYDEQYHDLWSLSERAPKHFTLLCSTNSKSDTIKRLLSGDWPGKRNIIVMVYASSVDEGKDLVKKLRKSVPLD